MSKVELPLATVLVADDSELNRELLSAILKARGYRVVVAADGAQALDALTREPIDLALLDVMMPGRSGFEVCRKIKSLPETRLIPVVLVTGLGSAEDRIQGIESGADDLLSKPVRKEELLARVRSLVRLKRFTDELESAETVLYTLARSIEAKDPYTQGHCDRLAHYAAAVGEKLTLSDGDCAALRHGGIVHDIGKVAVPEQILLKPGPLDAEERRVMQQHTVIGERICAPLKSFRKVLPIIRHHHERMDGSGYPDGLAGEQIPLLARILQLADLYDALSTDRPYRSALSPKEAFAVIREEARRGWWDGRMIGVLEEILRSSTGLNQMRVA